MSITKFVLDYSKWRSGLRGYQKVGEGFTKLRNEEGYMCCIGQWCQQSGVTDDELKRAGEPWVLKTEADISLFTESDNRGGLQNTKLTNSAIFINDELSTSPADKISKLTSLLSSYGIDLEVINLPK